MSSEGLLYHLFISTSNFANSSSEQMELFNPCGCFTAIKIGETLLMFLPEYTIKQKIKAEKYLEKYSYEDPYICKC